MPLKKRETLNQLREAKSITPSLCSINEKLDILCSNNVKKPETMPVPENAFSDSRTNVANQLHEQQLKVIGVPENDKKSIVDRQLTDKSSVDTIAKDLGLTQHKIVECRRLGKYDKEKCRPLLVTFNSVWDARLCRSKAIQHNVYKERNVLILPELSAADKIIEKKILKKRFELLQSNTDRKRLKIRNLKLYLDDQEVTLD